MPAIDKVSTEKHEGDIVCIASYGDQIFTGGADGKIKIWDKDLNLVKSVDAHESYIYALAVNSKGKLYSSSCDGCVKFMQPPYDKVEELLRCDDVIQSMYCEGDVLFTGDDKGVVSNWENDKMIFKYNLVEEVKSLAAEKGWIYTVRDLDMVISEIVQGKSGKYVTKAVLPGKSPLCLVTSTDDGRHKYIAVADRTGKGFFIASNSMADRFKVLIEQQDCHEMIINAICTDDTHLYTGGYDNKVKGWSDLSQGKLKALGEVDTGSCVNALCCCANNKAVYIACSDGLVRRANFL
ncbi:E3 ubiquitin-protein ligase TRAF7-like [Musca domestica]|uniref:E3 ubiquitin-protein ligase TRAF7-like n=1 Tax=Musca domestica TaxID=7370 RepID=T1PJI2_MUSDO|nr:E3 ubiquitin-protein ligase TRAF7-like [Musca domestica]